MAVSQNGWSVISSTDLDKSPFPGTNIVAVPGLRKGDVATVLLYVGAQFNTRVEKLFNPGCWGYANRNVIGSTSVSNHASGTAIDLNAPNHPLGASGTFSPSQVSQIRGILNECSGVVRWGGDYSGRKDEMHFEIVGNATQVANAANKLRGGQTMDTNAGVEMYRTALHREPENSTVAGQWNGKTPQVALNSVRGTGEWQSINQRLKAYAGLQAQVNELSSRPTKAELEAVVAKFNAEAAKVTALQSEKVEAEKTGNAFIRWIGELFNR